MIFLDHGATEALLAPWAVPIIRIICVQKMYGANAASVAPWLVRTMPNGAWSRTCIPIWVDCKMQRATSRRYLYMKDIFHNFVRIVKQEVAFETSAMSSFMGMLIKPNDEFQYF